MSAVLASGLGRRFGRRWALRDSFLEIPRGRIVALVGPNGAGKTTLLHLLMGLLKPTAGSVSVLGEDPHQSASLLRRAGFVAQDTPLYRSFTVEESLDMGRHLNPSWDDRLARKRLNQLSIPLDQLISGLSGGQRAQVSLAVALAKKPELLLLDEPLASLDPLARREFLEALMDSVAETGLTVILSSHLVADLERVCDHLVLLSASRTQVAGDIEDLLERHRVLTGRRQDDPQIKGVAHVVTARHTDRQSTLVVRTDGPIRDREWVVETLSLEELVIAYLESPMSSALPAPRLADAALVAVR
jgi:ABC-2 type transport system ATP-binding protein